MVNSTYIILPVALPLAAGILTLLIPKTFKGLTGIISFIATLINLAVAIYLFNGRHHEISFILPWFSFGADFIFRLYHFSGFILLAAAGFSILISLYTIPFAKNKEYSKQFFAYLLITLGFVNGAVLSDNLILMLFFWEGLLATLFGMIVIGGKHSFKTATKAFIISGVTDLCMMFGIAITIYISGTSVISQTHIPIDRILAYIGFIFLFIGAISKAGSMPFHQSK